MTRSLLVAAVLALPVSAAAANESDLRAMASAIERGDAEPLRRAFDCDAMLERAIVPAGGSAKANAAFLRGASGSCAAFAKGVVTVAAEPFSSYALVRTHVVGAQSRALFRQIADGRVNYHDMVLEPQPSGRLRIVDVHVYMTGEMLSETVRRGFLGAGLHLADGLKLTPEQTCWRANIPKIREFQELQEQGRHEEALRAFHRLPVRLQKDRTVLLTRFAAAAKVGGAEYGRAVRSFRRHDPDGRGMDLLAMEAFYLQKRYDEALAAIDRADRALGGDVYLDVLRAGILLEAGDPQRARNLLEGAAERDPSLIQVWFGLVDVALAGEDHDETLRLLVETERRFGVGWELEQVPEYGRFVRSPQYRRWQKSSGATAVPSAAD